MPKKAVHDAGPTILDYAKPGLAPPRTGANATMVSVVYPAVSLLGHLYAHTEIHEGFKGPRGFNLAFVFVISVILSLAAVGCAICSLRSANPNRSLSWFGLLFGGLVLISTSLAAVGI
jgi:hypothetical protein